MKTKFFSTVVMAILMTTTTSASVWRVSNVSNADAHFTGITEANNSTMVQSGDTLYIEPSSVSYGSASITKSLTLIGNGYFIAENPETQANTNKSEFSTLTFGQGSEGGAIMGCNLVSLSINTSNIRAERNFIGYVTISSNVSNIVVMQNYVKYSAGGSLITVFDNASNLIISSNYIENNAGLANSRAISMSSFSSAIFENNVIYNGVTIYNSTFYNNILRAGNFVPENSVYTNNIGNDNQFGNQNGNQQYVNMEDVFAGTGSTDGKWQLKPYSPAIGAGTGGQDCGMFGGSNPYILSGIPPIPAIYEYIQIYNTADQEVEVTFSVKSNN